MTLRFVAGNDRAALWYAPEDAIALVLRINVSPSRSRNRLPLDAGPDGPGHRRGRLYLAYQRWRSREQQRQAYSGFDDFLKTRAEFDPDTRFAHWFYTPRYRDGDTRRSVTPGTQLRAYGVKANGERARPLSDGERGRAAGPLWREMLSSGGSSQDAKRYPWDFLLRSHQP